MIDIIGYQGNDLDKICRLFVLKEINRCLREIFFSVQKAQIDKTERMKHLFWLFSFV